MKALLRFCFFTLVFTQLNGQTVSPLKVGDTARDFILTTDINTIRSFTLPQGKRIALLHFWQTGSENAQLTNARLLRLLNHYQDAAFINATGFEIIAVAVQNDLGALKDAVSRDSLFRFTHGMAVNGLEDEVCRNYGITALPTDILIDEKGIVVAINPRMADIENLLDERKNYQPIKRDLAGILASPTSSNQVLKYCKFTLTNYYGDSLTSVVTNDKGELVLHDLKINQDLELKAENASEVMLFGMPCIYSREGEKVSQSKEVAGTVYIDLLTNQGNKLLLPDNTVYTKHQIEEIDVIKSLTFTDDGKKLTPKDEHELNIIIYDMKKNQQLLMDFYVHTDSKIDATAALELTERQANAIKDYFRRKGLDLLRITGYAKGNSELRIDCKGLNECSEQDHRQNRRVEFELYKELTD